VESIECHENLSKTDLLGIFRGSRLGCPKEDLKNESRVTVHVGDFEGGHS
jgi:hypothetical protein